MSNEAITIHDRIHKMLTALGAVGKDGLHPHHKFRFRSIDQCLNAMAPALRIAGLTPSVTHELLKLDDNAGRVRVIVKTTFRLSCAEGGWESTGIGEGIDSQDKATNKAMSAGFKYAVFQGLVIPYEDAMSDDSDASPDVPMHRPQPQRAPAPRAPQRSHVDDELPEPPPERGARRAPNDPQAVAAGARVVTYDFVDGRPARKAVASLTPAERASAMRIAQNGVAKNNQYSDRAQQDLDAMNIVAAMLSGGDDYESDPPF